MLMLSKTQFWASGNISDPLKLYPPLIYFVNMNLFVYIFISFIYGAF